MVFSTDSLLLLGAGLIAGFVDAIAGGGGLITLPALLSVGVPSNIALGTNKLQSSCGTLVACCRYFRGGLIHKPGLLVGVGVTFACSVLGSWLVLHIPSQRLAPLIPLILLAVGVYTLLKPELGQRSRPARMGIGPFAIGFGILLGFYDGFFGPGAGSFWMTACVLVRGMDFASASGYTKAMNLASNLGALCIFIGAGDVNYHHGLLMAAGQLVGASLGSGIVLRRGAAWVRPVFLTIVFALVLKLLWTQGILIHRWGQDLHRWEQ